ncbi:MAG: Helix-turn-helix domain [Candidatus Eremiobacteraeota bacterium]|nr:Helix-turn-helix domain [Candidatus Eremiobacteraeota bacterium]
MEQSSRECRTLTVPEVAAALGVGLRTAYAAIHERTVPSIQIGRRIVVPRDAFEAFLSNAGRVPETRLR